MLLQVNKKQARKERKNKKLMEREKKKKYAERK